MDVISCTTLNSQALWMIYFVFNCLFQLQQMLRELDAISKTIYFLLLTPASLTRVGADCRLSGSSLNGLNKWLMMGASSYTASRSFLQCISIYVTLLYAWEGSFQGSSCYFSDVSELSTKIPQRSLTRDHSYYFEWICEELLGCFLLWFSWPTVYYTVSQPFLVLFTLSLCISVYEFLSSTSQHFGIFNFEFLQWIHNSKNILLFKKLRKARTLLKALAFGTLPKPLVFHLQGDWGTYKGRPSSPSFSPKVHLFCTLW